MLFYLGQYLKEFFGPARLFTSYTVLIVVALYLGFFMAVHLIPACYKFLPHDRGREFTLKENAEAAKGKPTGAGSIFISIFVVLCFLLVPMSFAQTSVVILTWITMLTGFLDDRSTTSWGEYLKGALDLAIGIAASLILYSEVQKLSPDGIVKFWLPFFTNPIAVNKIVYVVVCTVMIWTSINTTNCTDGVDGLSGTLVLLALLTLGCVFYFIFGHKDIAEYLLVPHFTAGANWAVSGPQDQKDSGRRPR